MNIANNKRVGLAYFLIFFIVFITYSPVLKLGFVWDDLYFLVNPFFLKTGAMYRIWHEPFFVSVNYFRPLVLMTFLGEYYWHGSSAYFYHLTNLLIHCINSVLVGVFVGLVINKAGKRRWWASFIAGLLYGLHPALLEATAWISGRFDLLMTLFALTLLISDRLLTGWKRYLALFSLFFCGALSKEMMAGVALLLPILHYARSSVDGKPVAILCVLKNNWLAYLTIVLSGFCYLAVRYSALGYFLLSDSPMHVGNAWQHALLVFKTFYEYMRLIFYPFLTVSPQHYTVTPVGANDIKAWFGLFFCFIFLIVAYRVRSRVFVGYTLAFFLSVLPLLNIIPLTIGENIVQDRFLQFPLAMFVCAVVVIVANFPAWNVLENKTVRVVGGCALVVWYTLSALNISVTLPSWSNNLSLWTWAEQRNKNSAAVQGSLAISYRNIMDYENAKIHAQKALSLRPDWWVSWNTAGVVYGNSGDHKTAVIYLRVAEGLAPKKRELLNNLGYELSQVGRYEDALNVLLKGLNAPRVQGFNDVQEDCRGYSYIMQVYAKQKNYKNAKDYLARFLNKCSKPAEYNAVKKEAAEKYGVYL